MNPSALWCVLAAQVLVGCGPHLSHGYFVKSETRYAVVAPPTNSWRQVDFSGHDLAWIAVNSGHLLGINSTCADHGDPSLEVLTTHVVMGFTDRTLHSRRLSNIDGREALESRYTAKLDGVPVELALVIIKKGRCVYDLTYVSPVGAAHEHEAEFSALLQGFRVAESSGP